MLFIFVTDLINAGKFSTIYNEKNNYIFFYINKSCKAAADSFMNVRNARMNCCEKKHICIFLT